ncbi:MAG: hypothetical protein ABFS35_21600, partial [Bacteroidota bacterium]
DKIKLAGDDLDLVEKLNIRKNEADERLEQKRKKLDYDAAKRKKAQALADIAIGTAVAIINIWKDVPKLDFGISAGVLSAMVGALGALQAAAVIAQPLPKYAEGTDNHKGGAAWLGDGGKNEIAIDPTGRMYISGNTPEIVNMEKGTKVIPDAQDFIQRQVLKTIIGIENSKNDVLVEGITDAVVKGFKGAKISNTNKIDVSVNHELWKNQLLN